MNNMTNTQRYLATIVMVLAAMVLGVLAGRELAPIQEVEVVKYVEVVEQDAFDTSIIEAQWCGGFEDGTVRMVGAWWYADGVVDLARTVHVK